ncbi:hypothetical protein DPMN_032187 [Dreissena polymorpha]|uniref:C-type lectin domain-containing protein n=1 Tax=Dreissena polymorpha TaxID=45954 RepID=A0A9D4M3Q5_DREPO|nr:hypothetical protein DPMN_032187 [Dreissena polymorpha]
MFVSWNEAQKYCIDIGGCLAGNNSNMAELNLAVSNEIQQTSGPAYWTGARKLDGLGWIWLNGDNVSITPIIDESDARCTHVWDGNFHDIACGGKKIWQYCICEVW